MKCLKDGRKRLFCPKSLSSNENLERAKFCVVSMVRSIGSVLCDLKMLAREQLDERIIFPSYLNVAANVLNESTFFPF